MTQHVYIIFTLLRHGARAAVAQPPLRPEALRTLKICCCVLHGIVVDLRSHKAWRKFR